MLRKLSEFVPAASQFPNFPSQGLDSAALDWSNGLWGSAAYRLTELKMDPAWDALCSEPRFIAVLKKLGLEK